MFVGQNPFKKFESGYKRPRIRNRYYLKSVEQEVKTEKFEDKLIDWTTFYRRNIHRFIEHYFGIKLYFYQKIMIYLMSLFPSFTAICARSASKSFITALFGCAICVLYPNSMVLVASRTKKQASLLITEKIEKQSKHMSPNLNRAIKTINKGHNAIEVIFHNGSSFSATVSNENARGLRSTLLIIDEFRMVNKSVIDTILIPTEVTRLTPYTNQPEYEHLKEEPREVYLSSAYYKSCWMWQHIKDATLQSYNGKGMIFATDFSVTLKHGIKTKKQLERARETCKNNEEFDMEYNNFMVGGNSDQYYSFDLIANSQKILKGWYPKTTEEYFSKKKRKIGDIEKMPNEIRICSMDIAMSESTDKIQNDFSVIKCIRCLLNGNKYERQEVYTERFQGMAIDEQAIRLRQIFEDFLGDYIVFDARTYGTNMVDSMARVLYDQERDVEYPPIRVMNNEALKNRCKNPNAPEIMWAFIGAVESNNNMHTNMKGALAGGKYKMLVTLSKGMDEYLSDKKEYNLATDEEKNRYEESYINSDLTLNEMINLKMEFVQGGKIKLSEPNNGTKDCYVASAMGNLFVQEELEVNLTEKEEDNSDILDYCMF